MTYDAASISITITGERARACTWDLDGDGAVDVDDLIVLLENWGVCP